VTYGGASTAAMFAFTNEPVGGTIKVGTPATGEYEAQIICATFLPGGVAYLGAKITAGVDQGGYEYWRVTQGGPGVGTVAGLLFASEVCYSPADADPGWNIFTINTGTITISEVEPPAPVEVFGAKGIVQAPSAKQCLSRRSFTIHVRQYKGVHYKEVAVYLSTKRISVSRGRRISAPIDLKGLPRGVYTITITVITNRGSRITGTRTYHTCRSHPLHPKTPPKL
jgi:hypothetical protein